MGAIRPATVTLLVLSIVGLAAGCSDDDDALIGVNWVLRSAISEGVQVYPQPFSPEVGVRFATATYEGNNGCSRFGGSYEIAGNVIVPSDQWGEPAICTIIGIYDPPHFREPFTFDIRGGVLTATGGDMTHVYDAR